MTGEEEVYILGQPVTILIPGNKGDTYLPFQKKNHQPTLVAGEKYNGFAVCDMDDFISMDDIYIQHEDRLHKISDWCSIPWYDHKAYIRKRQCLVTYERTYKMVLCLLNKIRDLENRMER